VLMLTALWSWRDSAQRRQDPRFAIDLQIGDENHELWNFPSYARFQSRLMKIIRMKGGCILMSTHRLSDYQAVGSSLAANMIGDVVGGFFFGLTPHDEALLLQERLGFSNKVREILETLSKGWFMYYLHNAAPQFFRVDITDEEAIMTASDQASLSMGSQL